MFWPVELPFLITVALMTAIVAAFTLVAPRLKTGRTKACGVATIVAAAAFIPACAGIGTVVDKCRFGTFTDAGFEEVKDRRVEFFLPPSAHDITVCKHASGFSAKYRIGEPELRAYLDELWARHGERSLIRREDSRPDSTLDERLHALHFGHPLGRTFLRDMRRHQSPVAPNGAGCTIWYSSAEGVAYSRAAYW